MLGCGVAATALYIVLDAVAALLYDGYSYKSQTISELSAIDAPTRSLWISFGSLYAVLMIAFGFGVWASAAEKRALRVVACAAVAMGVVGLVAWPFAPMHQREVLAAGGGTWQDTMHLSLSMVDGLLSLFMIGFGGAALGKRFRLYSLATILVAVVFGTLMSMESPGVAENDPTPWIGITERILVFGPMLWVAVLAGALWAGAGRSREMRTSRRTSVGRARQTLDRVASP